MAEVMLERRSILKGRAISTARVRVKPVGPQSRASLRAPEGSRADLSRALGFDLPARPKSSAAALGVTALWLGPDEWFLFAEPLIDVAGKCKGSNMPHSAADISHRNVALMVEGEGAADILNAGCPQNLSIEVFPVGACSRTLLGKAEVILYRPDVETFRVEVWRSFATYVADFLEEAARLDC